MEEKLRPPNKTPTSAAIQTTLKERHCSFAHIFWCNKLLSVTIIIIWYYLQSDTICYFHLVFDSISSYQLWSAIICSFLFAVIRHYWLLSAIICKFLLSSATFLFPCTTCGFSIICCYQLLSDIIPDYLVLSDNICCYVVSLTICSYLVVSAAIC